MRECVLAVELMSDAEIEAELDTIEDDLDRMGNEAAYGDGYDIIQHDMAVARINTLAAEQDARKRASA